MEYPKEVGIVGFKDGTFDCYPNCVGIPPSVDYIQKEIAQSLADALEIFLSDHENNQKNGPSTTVQTRGKVDKAKAALSNYRKGNNAPPQAQDE